MTARRAMLAKLHLAKKQLALTDDSYRDVLRRVVGADSAAAMTDPQLDRVLAEFRRLGWKPKPQRTLSKQAQIRMIHGVWQDLKPFVAEHSDAALRSFVARQTKGRLHPDGVSAPEFLTSHQANKVLEGLKAWLRRERAKEKAAA